MTKENFSNSKVVNAFTLATISTETTTYGAWIDTTGFESCLIALKAVITTGKITALVLQEANADDKGDAATAGAGVTLLNPDQFAVTASAIIKLGTVSKKKYVRVGVTTLNNPSSVNLTIDGIAFLGHSIYAPVDTNSTIDGVLEN